jgi:serine/threonine protein kinase
LREIQILKSIRHPNIISLKDIMKIEKDFETLYIATGKQWKQHLLFRFDGE